MKFWKNGYRVKEQPFFDKISIPNEHAVFGLKIESEGGLGLRLTYVCMDYYDVIITYVILVNNISNVSLCLNLSPS